jgi:hypothetical protein
LHKRTISYILIIKIYAKCAPLSISILRGMRSFLYRLQPDLLPDFGRR